MYVGKADPDLVDEVVRDGVRVCVDDFVADFIAVLVLVFVITGCADGGGTGHTLGMYSTWYHKAHAHILTEGDFVADFVIAADLVVVLVDCTDRDSDMNERRELYLSTNVARSRPHTITTALNEPTVTALTI